MISVMMPVYNAAQFLRKTMESVFNQTERDFELIVVNDGSTDKSEEIILSYNDPRIRYFKQENGGEAAARNTALDQAKGDLIVFQDSDDISVPARFEILKKHFTGDAIGFVHSDIMYIDEKDQPFLYLASGNIENSRMLRFFLKWGTPFNNPSMMVRRAVFDSFRYDTSLHIGTDTDMVFRTARRWLNVHVPQPLLLYRRHTGNLTNQSTYENNFLHVRKLLERHTIAELVPELDWEKSGTTDNQAKACAIIALILLRRAMGKDAPAWIGKAIKLAVSPEAKHFVEAIAKLMAGHYQAALTLLEASPVRDHLIENYTGEALSLMGRKEEAYHHYRRALELKPDYSEPLDQIKGLGWYKKYTAVAAPWRL
ncbi:MAG: glycosyltransferase [Bacillota bacterium]